MATEEQVEPPLYKHVCPRQACVFLGRYAPPADPFTYDLYWCAAGGVAVAQHFYPSTVEEAAVITPERFDLFAGGGGARHHRRAPLRGGFLRLAAVSGVLPGRPRERSFEKMETQQENQQGGGWYITRGAVESTWIVLPEEQAAVPTLRNVAANWNNVARAADAEFHALAVRVLGVPAETPESAWAAPDERWVAVNRALSNGTARRRGKPDGDGWVIVAASPGEAVAPPGEGFARHLPAGELPDRLASLGELLALADEAPLACWPPDGRNLVLLERPLPLDLLADLLLHDPEVTVRQAAQSVLETLVRRAVDEHFRSWHGDSGTVLLPHLLLPDAGRSRRRFFARPRHRLRLGRHRQEPRQRNGVGQYALLYRLPVWLPAVLRGSPGSVRTSMI